MKRLLALFVVGAAVMVVPAASHADDGKDHTITDTQCRASNTMPAKVTFDNNGGAPSVTPNPGVVDPMLQSGIAIQGRDENGNTDLGRGSVCVSDGTGNDVYVGGEVDTEHSWSFSCGAIEVNGIQGTGVAPAYEEQILGDDNWDNQDCQ